MLSITQKQDENKSLHVKAINQAKKPVWRDRAWHSWTTLMQLQGFSACSEAWFKGGAPRAQGELHTLRRCSGFLPSLVMPPHCLEAAEETHTGLQPHDFSALLMGSTLVKMSRFRSLVCQLKKGAVHG